MVLWVFLIPLEQKPDSLLSKKFSSLRKSEYRRSNSLWNTLLQRAVTLHRRSLRSNLSSPPAVSYHHTGANYSVGNPPPRKIPGLKCTGLTPFWKNSMEKLILNFKKMSSGIVQTTDLTNYTIGSLPQSRETIPFNITVGASKYLH
jgi:hypothetical protein